jgi:hypothetical protein
MASMKMKKATLMKTMKNFDAVFNISSKIHNFIVKELTKILIDAGLLDGSMLVRFPSTFTIVRSI